MNVRSARSGGAVNGFWHTNPDGQVRVPSGATSTTTATAAIAESANTAANTPTTRPRRDDSRGAGGSLRRVVLERAGSAGGGGAASGVGATAAGAPPLRGVLRTAALRRPGAARWRRCRGADARGGARGRGRTSRVRGAG